ncbi:MAG: hypothetical protein J0652_01205 [Desulfobulbaceae bacterium]|nr:hypothetical protein [Desulfobulbaceae bacterium]
MAGITRDEANLAARKNIAQQHISGEDGDKQQKAGNNVRKIFQGMNPPLPLQMTSPEREVFCLDTIHGTSDTRFIAGLTERNQRAIFFALKASYLRET